MCYLVRCFVVLFCWVVDCLVTVYLLIVLIVVACFNFVVLGCYDFLFVCFVSYLMVWLIDDSVVLVFVIGNLDVCFGFVNCVCVTVWIV